MYSHLFSGGMIIEDGTPPGATAGVLDTTLSVASKLIGVNTKKDESETEKSSMERTLAFLIMSHDDAGGRILLDEHGEAYVDWPGVGEQKGFEEISKRCLEITTSLGGTYVKNPIWTKGLGRKLVTVHPLGGCPMGETGAEGVVNHKGKDLFTKYD